MRREELADHIADYLIALAFLVVVKVLVVKMFSQPYPYGDGPFYAPTHILHGLPPIAYTLANWGLAMLIVSIIASGLYGLRFKAQTRPMSRISIAAIVVTLPILAGAFWWTI